MKRQVFFHLAENVFVFFLFLFVFCFFLFVCFFFEKMPFSFHMLLVMLFTYVGERSNSRSQMFFQTGEFHNIQRKTPALESLFNIVIGLKT